MNQPNGSPAAGAGVATGRATDVEPCRSEYWPRQAVAEVTAEPPCGDDDELSRIETEAAQRGKADFTLDAVVSDEAGQTVAVTHGLYQLRAHGK